MNTCTECGRSYIYKRSGGGTTKVCNSCSVNKRRVGLKQKCVDYKGGKCVVCGYNKCNEALDFHHIDESTKEFAISGSHARSWEKIRAELDKCALLCANCHREVHANKTILGG